MIIRGTHFKVTLTFVEEDGSATNVTGWELAASIKGEDGVEVIDAATSSGEFTVSSAADGEIEFTLTEAQTTALTTNLVRFDVVRTDISPGPEWLLAMEIDVRSLGD